MTFNFKLGFSELGPQVVPKNWADGTLFAKMAALQPAYWRIMCDWSAVYSKSGNNWDAYALDDTVANIQRYCPNTEIIMIFGQAKPSGWTNAMAQTFCAQMAARYGPLGVTHYECWNEPNEDVFWGGNVNPTAYVELLQAMNAGVKSVLPGNQSTIIFAGMQPVQFVGPWYGLGWETLDNFTFLRECYAAATKLGFPLGSIYDKMANHTYPYQDLPHSGNPILGMTVPCTVNNGSLLVKAKAIGTGQVNLTTGSAGAYHDDGSLMVSAQSVGEGIVTYYQPPGIAGPPDPFPPSLFMDSFRQIAGIIGLMQSNGDGGKGLWITESGICVYVATVDAKKSAADTDCPVQLLYTQQTLALFNMFPQIEVVVLYNGVDTQTGTKDNGITGYGTMTNTGGERQLYTWLLSQVEPSGGGNAVITAAAIGAGVVGPSITQSGVVYARGTGSGSVAVANPVGALAVNAVATGTGVVGIAPARYSGNGSLSVAATATGIGKVNVTSRNADLVVTAAALGEGVIAGIGGNTSVVVATATGSGYVTANHNEVGVVGLHGAGSLSVTATATGAAFASYQDAAALVVTASATGSGRVGVVGGGAQSVTATGTGAGSGADIDGGSLVASMSSTGAGKVGTFGAATLSVTATATGAATAAIQDSAALVVTATATGGGVVGDIGAAPVSVTATGAGAGKVGAFDGGSATITATGTGAGVMAAQDSSALVVTAAGTGAGVSGAVGGGSLSVTATAAGAGAANITGYTDGGSQTVTATATGTGAVGVVDTASEGLSVTATATGAGVVKVEPTLVLTPNRSSFSATSSPGTGTITGYTPVAGDIIAVWLRTGSGTSACNNITGWANALGSAIGVAATDVSMFCVYHIVTSAEATAGTHAWTLTSFFTAAQSGASLVAVLRGVNQTTPIDTAAGGSNSTASTSQAIPTVTPNNSGSIVFAAIGNDGTSTFSAVSSGWTIEVQNAGGQSGGALFLNNAPTNAGVAVGPATGTTSSTKCAAITVAFNAP